MSYSCYYLYCFVDMKKQIIGIIILLGIFIWWCTKKTEMPILFDDYYINIETKYSYKEIIANTISLSPTIKQYVQENQTWFIGSIIITKIQIQTGIDLSTFATNNSKSITRKVTGAEEPSIDKFSFTCKSTKINWILQKTTIEEWDQKQYMNQVFFIEQDDLYWISTITSDKKENKNLANSIKDITCPTREK